MADGERYFRIKRSLVKDMDLGRTSKEGCFLLMIMLNRAHYDTAICVFSYQEGASLLGCSRKKATGELENLKLNDYIDYQTTQGKRRFEVKLNFYYPVDPMKMDKKEQVRLNAGQVKEQAKLNSGQRENNHAGNKLRNKLERSNIIPCNNNAIECNEIQSNPSMYFFRIPVAKAIIEKYGCSNVLRKIEFLSYDHRDKPPKNPLGLLLSALENNYAPSDAFLEFEKRQKYEDPSMIRSGKGLANPFSNKTS